MSSIQQVCFQKISSPPSTNWQCGICLDGESLNSLVAEVGGSHIFHFNCLSSWYVRNPTCPLCRAQITSIESYEENTPFLKIISCLGTYLFPNLNQALLKRCINLVLRVIFCVAILLNLTLIYDFFSVLLSRYLSKVQIQIVSDIVVLALVMLYPNPF